MTTPRRLTRHHRLCLFMIAATAAAGSSACDKQSKADDKAPPSVDTTAPTPRPPPVAPPTSKAAPAATKASDMHPITLDWDLARDGDVLRANYTVRNTSDNDVFLLDRLTQTTSKGTTRMFDRAVVRDGADDGTVSFVRGYVAPSHPIAITHPPIARRLKAGETIRDKVTIPLPLTAWHNFAEPTALASKAKTQAVLEIGYLVTHDKWVTISFADGTSDTAPGHPFVAEQKLVTSAPKPLPAP